MNPDAPDAGPLDGPPPIPDEVDVRTPVIPPPIPEDDAHLLTAAGEPHAPPAEVEPKSAKRPLWKSVLGSIAIAGLVLAKSAKFLLSGLKIIPALLKTGGVMAVAIIAYVIVWGWPFAFAVAACLIIHEAGHIVFARMNGLKKLPAKVFIPIAGSYMLQMQASKKLARGATVALGGPVFGIWTAAACHFALLHYHSLYFGAIASTAYFLNLISLLPFPPMDGGRICPAFSRWSFLTVLPALGVLLWFHLSVLVLWILVISFIPLTIRSFRIQLPAEKSDDLYVSSFRRWALTAAYLGLAAIAVWGSNSTFKVLKDDPAVKPHLWRSRYSHETRNLER